MQPLLRRFSWRAQTTIAPAWGLAWAMGSLVLAGVVGVTAALGAAAAGLAGFCTILALARRRALPPLQRSDAISPAPSIAPATSFGWLLDSCADAIALTDLRGRIVHANDLLVEILGEGVRHGGSITGGGMLASRVADHEEFESVIRSLYNCPEQSGSGEIAHFGRALRVFGWVSEPVRDSKHVVIGRGFLFRDRTQERELAALKSDFLSTVTHELRTPLTSVKGSLQLVLANATGLSGINRELLDISLKNANRLIRLINDILDVSQLERGRMDLAFSEIATGPLVEEALAGLRAYAAGRDIAIGCEIEPDLPPIEGDRDRLIQVLTNVVSNAVKFSPVGGRVLVRAGRCEEGVKIAIRDWGVGICESDQARLFKRFQRVNPRSSEEPGTGLGLAISKAIVDRHGGRITVDSREAEGATFTVFLPRSVGSKDVRTMPDDGMGAAKTKVRPTLLLVDDDADLGTVLDVSLGGDYRLLRVESGVQALDVARAERPDLVLLDIALPDISGYDVLRILRHSGATRGIPVVILTVHPERELARSLGATDVVAKPVGIDELRVAIERMLRRHPRAAGLRIAIGPLSTRAIESLVRCLEVAGHAVFTAADPWDLLQVADDCDPDVLVVEAGLAGGGDRTIAFLRGHASSRRLPVVLFTDAGGCGPLGAECTPIEAETADEELVRLIEQAARQPLATARGARDADVLAACAPPAAG